jgi:hypothetical protein
MPNMMPNQPGQSQPSAQGQDQGGGVVQNVDEMLGAISEAIGSNPEAQGLSQRLMKVREEYRRIIEEAMKMGGNKAPSMPQPAERSVMPDRSQGMPQSPAGVY